MLSSHHKSNKTYDKMLLLLAVIAIVASAFHFWPFDAKRLWKLCNIVNLSIVAGFIVVILSVIYNRKSRDRFSQSQPPLSVWAYLLFHVLSCAYADTLSRPVMYTMKTSLMMVGGYLLLARAFQVSGRKSIVWAIIISCMISICSSLYTQYITKSSGCGFFENPYKYGTYTAVMGSFAIIYLLSGYGFGRSLFGFLVLAGLILTFRNIGALAGLFFGVMTGLVVCWRRFGQNIFHNGLLVLFVFVLGMVFNAAFLNDAEIFEKDDQNLRQRYIEWQAQINMLETYGVTGSGAGSINDHRSQYYYRLPKLNTLESFDQNGWLSSTAEIGIMGLLCFIWIIYEHAQYLLKISSAMFFHETQRLCAALLAGLVASCICNLFSSVYYNGVLIAFVVILALSRSVYYTSVKD